MCYCYRERSKLNRPVYEKPNTKQHVPCDGMGIKVEIKPGLVRVRKDPEIVGFMERLKTVTAATTVQISKPERVSQAVNAWQNSSKKSMKNRR